MKKRIGWLHNKPIIQGDKNLKNSNELHIDELSSSNSEGGGSNTGYVKFYRIKDYDAIKELLSEASYNVRYYESNFNKTIPIYASSGLLNGEVPDAMCYLTTCMGYSDDDFLEVGKNLPVLLENLMGIDSSCIEEITEEEYYRPLIELANKKEY